MNTKKKIVLSAQYLTLGADGIGKVARLTLMTLAPHHRVRAMAVEDGSDHILADTSVKTFAGGRVRFVLTHNLALAASDFAIYDFAGTARAHFYPGRPYALWVHGNEIWNVPAMRSDYRKVIKGASLILANSHRTTAAIKAEFGDLPTIRTCWLATEEEEPPEVPTSPEKHPPMLLFIGRNDLKFAKGQDILIRVWPRIVEQIPEARLCFVGGGMSFDRLQSLIATSPVNSNIDALWYVPQENLAPIWQRASALALIGNLEGFGLVVVEAMRWSKPVIASTQDACSEINIDGVTGYNVDRNEDDAVVSAVLRVLSDPDHAAQLGAAGHERWKEFFRPSTFAERLKEALKPLL